VGRSLFTYLKSNHHAEDDPIEKAEDDPSLQTRLIDTKKYKEMRILECRCNQMIFL